MKEMKQLENKLTVNYGKSKTFYKIGNSIQSHYKALL